MFKEAGANALIKEPLHELFETSIPLGSFSGYTNLSAVEEQLAEATNKFDWRIALVERFLLSKAMNRQADKLILTALGKIKAATGTIRINELAKSLYISQDAFEKRSPPGRRGIAQTICIHHQNAGGRQRRMEKRTVHRYRFGMPAILIRRTSTKTSVIHGADA